MKACPRTSFLCGHRNHLGASDESEWPRDIRNFLLSDNECVEPLENYFMCKRGSSLQAYAERSFGVFQENQVNVVWKFSPKAAPWAKNFLFHSTQKLVLQTDGSLIVPFCAVGLQEMAWYLAKWEQDLYVMKPKKLGTIANAKGQHDGNQST